MKPTTNSDQLHGTLEMLVLKVLESGPLHGYAIAVRLERMSRDVLTKTGRTQLDAEQASWLQLTTAVADVLNG